MENLDLISRAALLAEVEKYINPYPNNTGEFLNGLSTAISCIEEAPTIEAAPVVRGRWTDNKYDTPICSNCGKEDIPSVDGGGCFFRPPFCPFCGAKMDLEG